MAKRRNSNLQYTSKDEVTKIIIMRNKKLFFVLSILIIYFIALLFINPDFGFYLIPLLFIPSMIFAILILAFEVFENFYLIGAVLAMLFLCISFKSREVFKKFFIKTKEVIRNLFLKSYSNIATYIYITILITSTLKILEMAIRFPALFVEFQKLKTLSEKTHEIHYILPPLARDEIRSYVFEKMSSLLDHYISLQSLGIIFVFFICGICITVLTTVYPKSKRIEKLKETWWILFKFWGYILPFLATIAGLVLTIKVD